jgi:Intracellular proteinase inhibitor
LQRLLINPLMRRSLSLLVATYLLAAHVAGQEPALASSPGETSSATPETKSAPRDEPAGTSSLESIPPPGLEPTPRKRGWFGRMLHPFSSAPAPQYKDPRVRGLALWLEVSPQTVKLSEVRQLQIKVKLSNESKKAIELDFPNDQRIEIYLRNSAEAVLTKWSDNHAINDKPGIVLINPKEIIEYNATISTRELTPDKVFIAEVFFPKYPDLRAHQKFLTAP